MKYGNVIFRIKFIYYAYTSTQSHRHTGDITYLWHVQKTMTVQMEYMCFCRVRVLLLRLRRLSYGIHMYAKNGFILFPLGKRQGLLLDMIFLYFRVRNIVSYFFFPEKSNQPFCEGRHAVGVLFLPSEGVLWKWNATGEGIFDFAESALKAWSVYFLKKNEVKFEAAGCFASE